MQDELEEVAKEWTRVASEDAAVILVQYFERDLVSALANEFLKLDNGWVVTAFEACCAAGARTVVLRRGSGSGGGTQCVVPPVTLKRRYESKATVGLNYSIKVPSARPSEQFPDGHPGGCYDGSSIRSVYDRTRSGMELFLKNRGREHISQLKAGSHDSPQFWLAVYAKQCEPGGDSAYLPYALDGSDTTNVSVTKTDLREGQLSEELITETVDREQVALTARGKLYPAGSRLAQSSKASTPDPDTSSAGGALCGSILGYAMHVLPHVPQCIMPCVYCVYAHPSA